MVNHGYPWLTMDIHGKPKLPRTFMIQWIHRIPWIPRILRILDFFLGFLGRSMVNHGYDKSGDPNHYKNVYILQILELIPGFRGSSGSSGNGVRSRKPDPPKHAQESSDDVSSQQTPSNYFF